MKNWTLFFLLLIAPFVGFSQNLWTGNVNSDWNEAGNWSLGTVPGPTTVVHIKSTVNKPYPVLSGNVEIDSLNMYTSGSGGALYLGPHELKAGVFFGAHSHIFSEGGTLRISMLRLCSGMNFYGNLTLRTDHGVLGSLDAGNTFHGDLTVYANPHITGPSCWPCGSLTFSNTFPDTFRGNCVFIKKNAGSLVFGVNPVHIVFEKKVTFIDSSSTGMNLGFTQRGGSVTFLDSVFFRVNNSWVRFQGNFDFQAPVTFRQTGGEIELTNWTDAANVAKPTYIRFRKDVLLDLSGGSLAFGSWPWNNVINRSVIDSGGTIRPVGQGFRGGSLSLHTITIHSPHTQILASTNSHTASIRTKVIFNNAEVHGSIQVKADDIDLIGTTFLGKAILEKGGYAAQPNSKGGNTFYKPVELINSGGYDWNLGVEYSNVYRDSVLISLSGTGHHQMDSNRGARFKVGKYGSLFEGPVRIITAATHSGDIELESNGNTEFRDMVDISGFKSGQLTFTNSQFRGVGLNRTLASAHPDMKLVLDDRCLFEGPVFIQVPRFGSDFTTFQKPAVIQKTGPGDDTSVGGNTFHGQVQFLNTAASGQLHLLSGDDKLIK
ncbi:hypothetical protein GCM10027275_10360 [Rhabdobacter roseus]|uniref:G8 domain-containing protein n=1 Tax=Rhabdobacter roseus TaxID=1655419 RepID=A0A840THK7_9BACT|nr:hypothetical protein [Rhabdobacter roseus]MBB5282944.1 hypothetical protein [Rhabdobacter roseus]